MSTRDLRLSAGAAALLSAAALTVTLGACSQQSAGTGSSGDTSAQSDSAASQDSSAEGSASTSVDEEAEGDTMEQTPFAGGNLLEKELSGQEAIDALGDKIDTVAERVGKTPEELKELLLRDPSAHVTPKGFVVYRDSFPSPAD